MNWHLAGELAAHLVFPESCPVCGATGLSVCPECLERALSAPRPMNVCLACGGAFPCAKHGERFERRSLAIHRGGARDLLLAAKYRGSGRLSLQLGKRLAELVPEIGEGWAIVTVPAHPSTAFLPRGDSHLEWMARGLSRRTGFPVRMPLKWKRKLIPQKEQPDYRARRAMPDDSFVCAASPPEKVLLLDDVSTTGTTLLRAAQCLYAAGASRVLSLCWSVTAHP